MATEDRSETALSLPDAAYERLAAKKREDETVADVIERLGDEADIYSGFGIFADVEIRDAVAEVKREMDEDFEEHIDEVFRQ